MTQNILARGDALDPSSNDLIVQIDTLPVGNPVPEGWQVTSGNMTNSEIVRVVMRCDLPEHYED